MKRLAKFCGAVIFLLILSLPVAAQPKKFDGTWSLAQTRYGRDISLSLTIKQIGDQLQGEYGNVSSKESIGKILRARILGNTATLEIDCDWGGRGIVRITRLRGNRLHWQVIKRDERKGQFIVLLNEILTKAD